MDTSRGIVSTGPGPTRVPPYQYLLWSLLLAVTLSGVYALVNWRMNAGTGLTQTISQRAGVWYIPSSGLYDLSLSATAPATWSIDGEVAVDSAASHGAAQRTVWLSAGFHPIELTCEPQADASALRMWWAPAEGVLRPLNSTQLFPAMPSSPRLRAMIEVVRNALRFLVAASVAVFTYLCLVSLVSLVSGPLARHIASSATRTPRRVLIVVLPVLVVGYAAALRFDALTVNYGPVKSPHWLHSLQQHAPRSLQALWPASVRWDAVPDYPHHDGPPTKYTSDPYTYLQFARAMHSFYAAHYREPLFPGVTKVFLWILNDQDVAVSFASALFSVLAVVATYLLGSYAFSRSIGLGASLLMAIEYDVVSAGVNGGRDDAFMFAVVICAYAMLRYARVASRGNAIFLGVCGGLACLVRITAVSFLVPGFIYLLVTSTRPWKTRLSGLGVGVLTMAIVVGPYLFNCWRVFGDPLYAIDVHTATYLQSEGQVGESRPSAAAYVESKMFSRPMRMLDTVALGLTSYPFLNKWQGFDRWLPSLGVWLSWAALFGLIVCAGSGPGRLLLLVLVTSLLPFAVTWTLIADWRFTQHAYPLFLVASCVAIGQVIHWAAPSNVRALFVQPRRRLTRVAFWTVLAGGIVVSGWLVLRVLPVLAVRESLAAHDEVTIMAGGRDFSFFGEGWSAPLTGGSVTSRVATGASAVMWLPLPRAGDYDLTVRLDPFPRPLGEAIDRPSTLRMFVNGRFVSNLDLRWNPARVGAYEIHLPRSFVTPGQNRLTFVADKGAAFDLWYVRVRPLTAAGSAAPAPGT